MKLWRISEFADLTGEGGLHYAARWNEGGLAIVYCSDHPSTSLLEILVHSDRDDLPPTYQLLEILVPDKLPILQPEVPRDWLDQYSATQRRGTQFLLDLKHPIMRVPSVVMPQASNYLLNPNHPDAASIRIVETWRYPFDSRLLA